MTHMFDTSSYDLIWHLGIQDFEFMQQLVVTHVVSPWQQKSKYFNITNYGALQKIIRTEQKPT